MGKAQNKLDNEHNQMLFLLNGHPLQINKDLKKFREAKEHIDRNVFIANS